MTAPYEVPRISVSSAPLHTADTDLIIVPIAQDQIAAALSSLDPATADDVRSAIERGEFRGTPYEIYVARTPAQGWRASRVVCVGGGPRGEMAVERFRRMASSAAQVARHQRRARIAWADVEPGALAAGARVETIAEGIVFANFDNGFHKSRNDEQFFIKEAAILTGESVAHAAVNGQQMGESINAARAADQRAGECSDAARDGRQGRGAGVGRRRDRGDSRREAGRKARHGIVSRRRPRQRRAAAITGLEVRAGGSAGQTRPSA